MARKMTCTHKKGYLLRRLVTLVVASFVLMSCNITGGGQPNSAPESQAANTPVHAEGQAASSPSHDKSEPVVEPAQGQATVEMPHIHGMGFSTDGRQLLIAAHDGLRVFGDGKWSVPDLPAHDYMGYVATDDGFYSSGHPHPTANMVKPFGLIKSTDGGQTLTRLGFEGESDFHLMGVGYQSHAIYVLNLGPNSKLSEVGVYYSLDDGQTWRQSAMQGLTSQPIQIAVHPIEANVLAIGTESGLLLSTDYGDTLALVGQNEPISSVTFSPDGETLFLGYQKLSTYDLAGQQFKSLTIPALAADDGLAYLAVNPTKLSEMALATFQRNIYLSTDAGQSWSPIAQNGRGNVE